MTESSDVLVIGAGIAGASLAYELARDARVIVLEQEAQPGRHATGRSAALFTETYGPPQVRALTRASRPFYENPPEGFARHPILSRRGAMVIGRADQEAALERAWAAGAGLDTLVRLSAEEARAIVPVLRQDYVAGAVLEPDAMDIDVHGLHQGYLRGLKARGGRLVNDAEVLSLERRGAKWRAVSQAGAFEAPVMVNAAGAWGDVIAGRAGVAGVGLVPKRRTAFVFRAPDGVETARWPMVVDADESFYVKPEAGRLLASPADATPVEPGDVWPDDMDVAIAADRIERATILTISRVEHRWAGLRSFVADGIPVVGDAPDANGFFWFVAQGGYGIQTASALARLGAALIGGRPVPDDVAAEGVRAEALAPTRLVRP